MDVSSVTHRAISLALSSPTSQPLNISDDDSYREIASTIIEELDPSFKIQSFDISPFEQYLDTYTRSIGFLGSIDDRNAVLDFLMTSLQAHRILAQRALRNPTETKPYSKNDELLANDLSRICIAIGIPIENAENLREPKQVAQLLDSANKIIQSNLKPEQLGDFLLPTALTPSQSEKALQISDQLRQEHALRKGLVLNRLSVTIDSFRYSALGQKSQSRISAIERSIERSCEAECHVTLYDAITARDYMLESPRISEGNPEGGGHEHGSEEKVKTIIMGSVPDRGGRVGKASAGEMPAFKERVDGFKGGKGKGRDANSGQRKGKGGKRRRGK